MRTLIALLLILSTNFSPLLTARAETISNIGLITRISADHHGLIELDEEILAHADTVIIDASPIGGGSELILNPELGKVSIKASHDIEAGIYDLPVEIYKGDQLLDRFNYPVEVYRSDLERSWDEETIYFLLTDRFNDGDTSNNDPFNNQYEQAENQGGVYQGGDFKGITDKLEYLSDLGVTTLWISPIVLNVKHNVEANSTNPEYYAYHGYWALDFQTLNPHFGSIEDLHDLIDRAAEYDIHIMVDVVLNHVGYGLHPDDSSTLTDNFPTDEDRNRFLGMIRIDEGNDDMTISLSGLPDFITEDPEVRETIVEWQTDWLDLAMTDQGNTIQSYRVDTANHVDKISLQYFKNRLVSKQATFNLLGESWGANFRNPKGFLNSGTMDSVLDFDFKDQAAKFVNGQMEGVNDYLIERNQSLSSTAILGQFLSSHDEVGFLYKMHYKTGKAMLAASLQMTAKGQPVIYYGEELGQTGANNWPYYDNRYLIDWENYQENPMLDHYQRLIHFRRQFSKVLARGDRQWLAGSNEEAWLAISREFEGQEVIVVFNRNDDAVDIELAVDEADYFDHYSHSDLTYEDGYLKVSVPGIEEGGTSLISLKETGE